MSEGSILQSITVAVVGGLVVGLAALILIAKSRSQPVQWRIVGLSLAVSLAATSVAFLLGFLNSPDGGPTLPTWIVASLSIVLMPASSVLGLLGPLSLSPVPFFGEFVLNIVVWSVLVYLVTGRRRAAQA